MSAYPVRFPIMDIRNANQDIYNPKQNVDLLRSQQHDAFLRCDKTVLHGMSDFDRDIQTHNPGAAL